MNRALLALTMLLPGAVMAAEMAVVIDDLGHSSSRAERVLSLPAPVTLALLPFAPATAAIAHRAVASGHEVILHQPMEALALAHAHLAPGTLTVDMPPDVFGAQIEAALSAIPGLVGINNHTGSRLTQDVPSMRRLMSHLSGRDLLFLDSRTTAATVAYSMAREARVPALKRDVFLDHVPEREAIAAEFERALSIARRQGHAVIIAHPYDVSLEFLAVRLESLPRTVSLVTLRRLAGKDRPVMPARLEDPASPRRSLGQ